MSSTRQAAAHATGAELRAIIPLSAGSSISSHPLGTVARRGGGRAEGRILLPSTEGKPVKGCSLLDEAACPCSRPSEEKCLRAETCQLAAPGLPATAGAEPPAGVPPSSSECAAASPALLKIPASARWLWAASRSCLALRAAGAGDFSSPRHEILRAKLHSSRSKCTGDQWLGERWSPLQHVDAAAPSSGKNPIKAHSAFCRKKGERKSWLYAAAHFLSSVTLLHAWIKSNKWSYSRYTPV